jgi:hypothetical protein
LQLVKMFATMSFKRFCILLLVCIVPATSFGWNGQGHRTAGALVYYYLKANNRPVIDKILKTLSHHPWYNGQWAAATRRMEGERREIELFMLASTFPDDARGTDLGTNEQGKWHYVDYAYVVPGKNVHGEEPQTPNAEQKINELLNSLGTAPDDAQKAINICWLFHLVEDIHQPLHCASMFDANHPHGDKGGNSTWIRVGYNPAQKLHQFWDGAPVADNEVPQDKAWELMTKFPQPVRVKENTTVNSWIQKESLPQAIKYAYLNGQVNGYDNQPTALGDDYTRSVVKLCERRLVESGYRLSEELKKIFG